MQVIDFQVVQARCIELPVKRPPPNTHVFSFSKLVIGTFHNATGVDRERRVSVAGMWVMYIWIISHAT